MLNPKEYRFIRTEILAYEELLMYKENSATHTVLASRNFDCEIKKYQKEGYVIEIGNMTSDALRDYKDSAVVLYSLHLMLYKPIAE